jgi:hypothetical protein
MRIISFDVGIKNMAYCILDVSTNNAAFPEIVQWDVLNLLKEEETHTCNELTNKKKLCGKKSKYCKIVETISNESITKYACEVHAKSHSEWFIRNKPYLVPALKKTSVCDLRKIQNSFIPSSECSKKAAIIEELNTYFQKHCWEPIKSSKVNAGHVNLIYIGRELFQILSKNSYMNTVTHVLIENQISPIANRMKTIQGMLAQHFISLSIPYIEFVSSGNKLKEFNSISQHKNDYQKNKQDGVFHCTQLLETHSMVKWQRHFQEYKSKKDDLADCFLQGIWWWKKNIDKI